MGGYGASVHMTADYAAGCIDPNACILVTNWLYLTSTITITTGDLHVVCSSWQAIFVLAIFVKQLLLKLESHLQLCEPMYAAVLAHSNLLIDRRGCLLSSALKCTYQIHILCQQSFHLLFTTRIPTDTNRFCGCTPSFEQDLASCGM